MPFEGTYDYITATLYERLNEGIVVLGILENLVTDVTEAVFHSFRNITIPEQLDSQKWLRKMVTDEYFTLQNQYSGKYLTARSNTRYVERYLKGESPDQRHPQHQRSYQNTLLFYQIKP